MRGIVLTGNKIIASNMPRLYLRTPICKPYIFHRADLVNTEIIITISLKPLIFSPDSVGTYEGQFIPCCSLHRLSNTKGHNTKHLCYLPIFSKAVKLLPAFSLYLTERLLLPQQIYFCPDAAALKTAIYIIANNTATAFVYVLQ